MAHPGGRPSDNAKFVDNAYSVGIDTSEWLIYPKIAAEILGVPVSALGEMSTIPGFPKVYIRGTKQKRKMYKTGDVEKYAAKCR